MEKIMDGLDKFLQSISYKFPKGYPDINNEEDKKRLFEMVSSLIEEEKPEEIQKVTEKSLIDLIKGIDLNSMSDKQKMRLYLRLANFGSYKPILKTLQSKKYNPLIVKKYAKEIQDLIEILSPKESKAFVEYLNDESKHPNFPTQNKGNLYTTLKKTGVPTPVIKQIISHTSQDEGKRGVGMGELGLALLYKDVTAPSAVVDEKGKKKAASGDLEIDGEKFEIKGTPATLGAKPELHPINISRFEPFGLKIGDKKGYVINDKDHIPKLNQFSQALSDTYKQTKDKKGFKQAFKDGLIEDVGFSTESVNSLFDNIDFSTPLSIQEWVSGIHLYNYASNHNFKHFLVHDFGKNAPSKGDYIYVSGTPEEMVKDLISANASFQPLKYNNLRPRVGFGKGMVETFEIEP